MHGNMAECLSCLPRRRHRLSSHGSLQGSLSRVVETAAASLRVLHGECLLNLRLLLEDLVEERRVEGRLLLDGRRRRHEVGVEAIGEVVALVDQEGLETGGSEAGPRRDGGCVRGSHGGRVRGLCHGEDLDRKLGNVHRKRAATEVVIGLSYKGTSILNALGT